MDIPVEALELENRSLGKHGEPTLAKAYEVLLECWRSRDHGRELGLHLMFLAWYMLCQPPCYTGQDEGRTPSAQLVRVFNEVHDYFASMMAHDAEFLYVVGLMAHLFPYLLGDEAAWETRSQAYRVRYREIAPKGIDPSVFQGRGAYGEYFCGQARVADGY